jgi:hypothetical protein
MHFFRKNRWGDEVMGRVMDASRLLCSSGSFYDNMQRRPIKGTTELAKYELVLFVPNEATSISYGVLLDGTGQIWF